MKQSILTFKRKTAILPIALISLVLFFAGPPKVSADILGDISSCSTNLALSQTCALGPYDFFTDFLNPSTSVIAQMNVWVRPEASSIDYLFQISNATQVLNSVTFITAGIQSGGILGTLNEDSAGGKNVTLSLLPQSPTTSQFTANFDVNFEVGDISDKFGLSTTIHPGLSTGTLLSTSSDLAFAVFVGPSGTLSGAFRHTPTPEPSTLLLLGSGLLGFIGLRRRNLPRDKSRGN